MTTAKRLRPCPAFALGLLLLMPLTAAAQRHQPIADKIAKTYGLASFGQIEAVRYTFNVKLPGIDLTRSWTWQPKTDQVTYERKDKSGAPVTVTYQRSQLDSQSANVKEVIDPGFVNDQYWLLLPFHAVWDTTATVTDAGKQKLPLGPGTAEKVVMKYPADGGYSQGDTWDLYVRPDGRIEEMVYHRGGPKKPSLVVAGWADHKKAGPLLVSLEHQGTPMASRCMFSSRMSPSSWRDQTAGSRRNRAERRRVASAGGGAIGRQP